VPNSYQVYPQNATLTSNPNNTMSFDPTSIINSSGAATELPEITLEMIETAVTSFLGALETVTGIPLELLSSAFTTLFGDVGSFDPLTAITTFITLVISLAGSLPALPADLIEGLSGLFGTVQGTIDGVIGGITGDPNSTDNPVQMLFYWVQQLTQGVQTAGSSATSAFNLTTTFGGVLSQITNDLDEVPGFTDAEDFAEQMASTVGTFIGNILTSLSPQNPSVAAANTQISALWAAQNTTTAGIHYNFSDVVALSAPVPGDTADAWGTFTGQTISTVVDDYLEDSSGPKYAVWTATNQLKTDEFHVAMTIEDLSSPGINEIICCVNSPTAPTQYVALQLALDVGFGIFFGSSISIFTYTGVGTGSVEQVSQGGITFSLNDVIAIQYSAGSFTMFQNGVQVGSTWDDTGGLITHGAGHRGLGVVTCVSGSGPGLGNFVAYDY
jgi:hypothetical protein